MTTKAFKNEKIESYKKQFENAKVAVVADYRGLTVEEITNLRRELQKQDADLTVTKNTLCKVASKGTSFEPIEALLKGPTAVAFGFGDEVNAAKVLSNFIKETKKCEITGAVLDGKVLSADEAKQLANLPSKEELYAKILGSINSPASGIVYSINGIMSALTRAINAVKDKIVRHYTILFDNDVIKEYNVKLSDIIDGNYLYLSKNQLINLSAPEKYLLADRLVEYLSGNAITHIDEVIDNIKKVQILLAGNKNDSLRFDAYGIWDKRVNRWLYRYLNTHTDSRGVKYRDLYDNLLYYVDKDVESLLSTLINTDVTKKRAIEVLKELGGDDNGI